MAQAQEFIRSHTTERPTITSFDGLKLQALYLPAQGEAKGTIVAFHGYRSLAPIDFALEVEFFHTLGYDVLLPYQRSHGLSQGKYITYGVKERFDCRDWAWYAARRWGDRPLFLMGISMGCATVVMASGLELPPSTRGNRGGLRLHHPLGHHGSRGQAGLPPAPLPLLYVLDWVARLVAALA